MYMFSLEPLKRLLQLTIQSLAPLLRHRYTALRLHINDIASEAGRRLIQMDDDDVEGVGAEVQRSDARHLLGQKARQPDPRLEIERGASLARVPIIGREAFDGDVRVEQREALVL